MSDESNHEQGVPVPETVEKLVHLALPVRLTHMVNGGRGALEMACTYDIHPHGARLLSFRNVKVGDLVTIERGRKKAVCEVVWTADPRSELRGQFTVQAVNGGKVPWEEELREAEERYVPADPNAARQKSAWNPHRRADQNRRRRPRFSVEGCAELDDISGKNHIEGRLAQLSELGCLVSAPDLLVPGTDLRMVLNLYDVSVALKGQVKYMAEKLGMGVEFHEIRQGDRPLLNYVLNQFGETAERGFLRFGSGDRAADGGWINLTGAKAPSILHTLRGAEAPLFHGCGFSAAMKRACGLACDDGWARRGGLAHRGGARRGEWARRRERVLPGG